MRRVLPAYIKRHLAVIILFGAFIGIFAGVFSLYNLEVEAVWYAGLLCTLLALGYFVIHFIIHLKKCNELERMKKNITELDEAFPSPRGLIEEQYQEIIALLREENNKNLTHWQMWRQDSIDYYMVWAHQIKSPIAVMRLVLQSEDTGEHEELLYELFRIEQYVEMVLSYFRLDSRSNDFIIKEYDLDDILKSVIRKYASQFIRKQIRLDYQETGQAVLTDEKWLGFIIEQVLSNSIKYTNAGVIKIAMNADQVLSISDTGIGIAAEDIPRIFEKGYTGYNGRADKKSTGLGLYLCKLAADKLSHKISVESNVNQGTSFFIDLKKSDVEIE